MLPRNTSAIASLFAASLIAQPARAHKTEVSGDVAGTWHIEPNHSPKTGEPARIWVALTQRGGRAIPLTQCDCQLEIYATHEPSAEPVLAPALEAMSPETYQEIPGATVTFPDVGEYRLQLSGRPTNGAEFAPFELSYTTVVAAGSARATPPPTSAPAPATEEATAPVASQPAANSPETTGTTATGLVPTAIGCGVAIALAIAFIRRRRPRRDPSN